MADGHADGGDQDDRFSCRCRLSPARIRSRPRGASQYVVCSVGDAKLALCRVALSTTAVDSVSAVDRVDASVTLRRDSRVFRALQPSLLASPNSTTSESQKELHWVSRGAVSAAAAVTLELLASETDAQNARAELLMRDGEYRTLLQQTLQRNFMLCAGANVRLPTPSGLAAKWKGAQADGEDLEQTLSFRVVSTYPASGGFVRLTPATRVTLTQANKPEDTRVENKAVKPSVVKQQNGGGAGVKLGGMESERAALRELIMLPVLHPKLRTELGVQFPKGVLLCGPPGVGKTLLVRAVVHECRQQQVGEAGDMLQLQLQVINGAEILTSGRGDAEQALRGVFAAAVAHARSLPGRAASVIFIDELDALCPKRSANGSGGSSSHSRIVAQLLTLLDGVEGGLSRENVVIVAATNLPNAIDAALRRPGRFDREIFISPPGPTLRKSIFRVHLDRTPYALGGSSPSEQRETFLDTLAAKAVGYVGADIAALCREAVMVASTRQLVALARDRELEQWWTDWKRRAQALSTASSTPASTLGAVVAGRAWHENPTAVIPLWFLAKQEKTTTQHKLQYFRFLLGNEKQSVEEKTDASPANLKPDTQTFEVTMADFDQAMQSVVASALRGASGFAKDFERLGWDSIGGQAETKLALQQALEWPVKFPQTFARLGVQPPRGVLLYGPPGCSKSSVVRAAAHSSGATFLSLSAAQVFSPFFGDAEASVRQVFRDARAALPAIVFFDEVDVMVAKREFDGSNSGGEGGGSSTAMRVLSTMLNEMDGVESADGLLVIGATNRPQCIDAALMRPGRFDRICFVNLPTEADRADILRIHSRPMKLQNDVDLDALAQRTPFFSGAELENLCREAALLALRESLDAEDVALHHFEEALRGITPVSDKESMREYLEFAETMGHLA